MLPEGLDWVKMRLFTLLLFALCAFGEDWSGVVRNGANQPLAAAKVTLRSSASETTAATDANGRFQFAALTKAVYKVSVAWKDGRSSRAESIELPSPGLAQLIVSDLGTLTIQPATAQSATGGEQLSAQAVSGLPLNKRDFSALLLLAAGTMTDSNGSSNFTPELCMVWLRA